MRTKSVYECVGVRERERGRECVCVCVCLCASVCVCRECGRCCRGLGLRARRVCAYVMVCVSVSMSGGV